MNEEITLCDFINNISNMQGCHNRYDVEKIIKVEDVESSDNFFKWDTASHDDEISFCPKGCHNCCSIDDDYECNKIELNYYVEQWTTNMDGDSYSGNLVYPLKDYYVFVSYDC